MSKPYTKIKVDIPFTTVTPDLKYLPTQLADDSSLFMLYAQKTIHINPQARTQIATGIRITLPDIVETTKEGDTSSNYSKLSLQMTLHSTSFMVESKGIVLLAPTILASNFQSEIILCCVNLTKEVQTIHPGDELVILAFNLVPRIQLQLAPTLTYKGNPYAI